MIITYRDLRENCIEVQGNQLTFVYYDETENCNVEIDETDAKDMPILYIYPDNDGGIVIEVERKDEDDGSD